MSQGVGAALAGPYADRLVDGNAPHLAVADLAGAGGLDDDLDQFLGVRVLDEDLDADLGDEVDGVFGAAVDLGVPRCLP